MNPARKIRWRGVAEEYEAATRMLLQPGDAAVVERGVPRWLLLKCPCGCGGTISLNLDSRTGPAWRMRRSKKGLSVSPSVWRTSDCHSHFIIWHDEVIGVNDSHEWTGSAPEPFTQRVKAALSESEVSLFDLAYLLDERPWDVLAACSVLVKRGEAEQVGVNLQFRTPTTRTR
jgi:hypothetical protein